MREPRPSSRLERAFILVCLLVLVLALLLAAMYADLAALL